MSTETIDLVSAERVYLNTIKGQVLDTLDAPISSVRVKIRSEVIYTDENGRFEIVDVMISSTGEFISATHPDYYDGGIRVYANAPITQTVNINLVPRGASQNFSNEQGATLKVADLAEVTIPSNTFLANGQLYEGMVSLEVYLVNPNTSDSYNKRLQVFETYESSAIENKIQKSNLSSIFYIEAQDQNGNLLTVSPDKKVKALVSTYGAPNTNDAKLFSFDEEIGFWKAEDEVFDNGEYFEIELSHFSWWGVGSEMAASDLCITFTNVNEQEGHSAVISNTLGKVLFISGITYGAEMCFPVPADEIIEIRVFNTCFKEIFSISTTSASDGLKSETIDVESITRPSQLIEIHVVDCNNTTLEDSVTIYFVTDLSLDSIGRGVGTFDLLLDECFRPEEITIQVVQDVGITQYSYAETIMLNDNQDQYNIQIVACQDVMPLDGHLTINGITYSKVTARQNPQETLIIASEGDDEVVIGFDGFEIGTFPGRVISFKSNVFCEGKVSIGHYGEIGDFIEGNFEIPADEALGCEHITGDFRAMREN